MNCKKIFLHFLLFTPFLAFSQEQLGLRFDNYSGVNSLVLNPANNLTSKFSWDINLAEAGVFFDNSYGFIGNANLIRIAQNSENIISATEENPGTINPNTLIFDFYNSNQSKFVSSVVEVMGPSFMVNLASGNTFGLFTRARFAAGSKNIPASLGYYSFESALDGEQFSIPRFKFSGMAWSEFGINYAREFYTSSGTWGIGANIRLLSGYESFFVNNQTDFQITRFPGDSFEISDLDLTYGFTTGSINAETFNTKSSGTGFGADLGAIFTIEESEDEYKLKFGISILDIGKISFNRNTENHYLQYSDEAGFSANDFDIVTELDQGLGLLSELLLGDESLSEVQGGYGIWLPTALSLQADLKVVDMFYVNATLVQGIPMPGPALSRDHILAVSPRFEHRWFGVATPVVFHNWQDFRIGTSMRLAFLTIGTDNLGSFVGNSDFTGTDFYLALKVNPFNISLGGGPKTGKRGKNVRCYEF